MKTASTSLRVFTGQPQGRREFWQTHPYRNVVGIASDGGELWLPGDYGNVTAEELEATADFASQLTKFFMHSMVNNGPRNCHTYAAMMNAHPSAAEIGDASDYAASIIREGQPTGERLELGQQGVYGWMEDDRAYPVHSVIGLGRDNPEVIQVDQQGGQLSLVPYRVTHDPMQLFTHEVRI